MSAEKAEGREVVRLSFKRRGDIMRDGIRVGWIERHDTFAPLYWTVRLTTASGRPGRLPDRHVRLGHAKAAAIKALSLTPPKDTP